MNPLLYEISVFGRTFPIHSYGAALGISLLLGWSLFAWLCEREGINRKIVDTTTMLVFITAIVGARLFDIAINYGCYGGKFFSAIFSAKQQGLTFYGGLIPAVAVGALYVRFRKLNVWQIADCSAPALGMGLFFTRIGCFLAGCCFGIRSGKHLGVSFPPDSPAFNLHLQKYALAGTAPFCFPVYPTQLYSSLAGLILAIAGFYFLIKKKQYHGQVFWAFIFFYALFRFLIEFIREDPGRGALSGLSTSQWISVIGIGLALFYLRRLKAKG